MATIFQRQAELSRRSFEQGCVYYDVGDDEQQNGGARGSDGEYDTAIDEGQVWFGTSSRGR